MNCEKNGRKYCARLPNLNEYLTEMPKIFSSLKIKHSGSIKRKYQIYYYPSKVVSDDT
ncbi:hypothetical protein T4E_8026 [Trichinella pseudospiralis]|uniref:Uncharacterized protein n=1 Tax=Trichinella pseudospiralis TaxID=6337 RepID=A0A0V0XD66_TRIPS|nr:hypothetical protein T4E_8026 [Trichinella pseudospiralis]